MFSLILRELSAEQKFIRVHSADSSRVRQALGVQRLDVHELGNRVFRACKSYSTFFTSIKGF